MWKGIKTEDDDIRDEAAKIAEQEAAAAAALKNQKLQERIADHQINKREAKQSQNIVQQKEVKFKKCWNVIYWLLTLTHLDKDLRSVYHVVSLIC